VAFLSLRHFINLIEAAGKKGGQPQKPWGIFHSSIFDSSMMEHLRVFPDLGEKLAKFIEVKLDNPLVNKYGKHDRPMTGPLVGFWHCHLRDDAILIYNFKDRDIQLVCIVSHAEIEGKRTKAVVKRIAPFKA